MVLFVFLVCFLSFTLLFVLVLSFFFFYNLIISLILAFFLFLKSVSCLFYCVVGSLFIICVFAVSRLLVAEGHLSSFALRFYISILPCSNLYKFTNQIPISLRHFPHREPEESIAQHFPESSSINQPRSKRVIPKEVQSRIHTLTIATQVAARNGRGSEHTFCLTQRKNPIRSTTGGIDRGKTRSAFETHKPTRCDNSRDSGLIIERCLYFTMTLRS